MTNLLETVYKPDVLSCLSDLSNDEVFTPPELANAMLDLLPNEIWSNPNIKILEPCSKSGVFLREAAKRFIEGEKEAIPDLQERIDHIMHNQLYGIAITEMTSLMSRRTLYCSKYPNGPYSVSKFDTVDGNIRFKRINHSWNGEKCIYCGATKAQYDRSTELETHAYEFIHFNSVSIKEIDKMKFDVICGNPPYQINIGVEKENYSVPIYQKFVEQAIKLNPRYLTMIIPARWYAGGRGLDDFRHNMLNDSRIRVIHDYPDASDCFPGVQIKAGVCYFLWDKNDKGDCSITTHLNGKEIGPVVRPLLENGSSTFIRYNQAISIVKKVYSPSNRSFSELVSPQTPFGLVTSYKGNPNKISPTDVKMYISGNEKQFKGGFSYTPLSTITKGKEMIPWHKVYINMAGSGSDSFPHQILGKPFYGEPGTICNQSYLVIGPFNSKQECENVMSYISTKFFRFMVLQKKNAQHAMRGVYQFVPVQDFSKPWTDEELYAKYGLTEDEIAFIDSMIKPMELDGD